MSHYKNLVEVYFQFFSDFGYFLAFENSKKRLNKDEDISKNHYQWKLE